MDDERSSSSLAVLGGAGAGYEADLETYRKPPRWLKNLDSEEDETRVLNYAINLSLVLGTGVLFGIKFFAIDADIWRGWTITEILSAVPRDNWSFYEASLASHPIVSKAFISGHGVKTECRAQHRPVLVRRRHEQPLAPAALKGCGRHAAEMFRSRAPRRFAQREIAGGGQ